VDVKQYYRKVREAEISIQEEYPLMVSLETSDGGKAGVISEVSREVAAKMIVEGRAVVASPAEEQQYRQRQAAAKKSVEAAELARRVQVAIISESDLQASGLGKKPSSNGK
jgi:hypothetical protein